MLPKLQEVATCAVVQCSSQPELSSAVQQHNMIEYEPGYWGVGFLFSLRGSVFPKAACLAVPNALLAGLIHIYLWGSQSQAEWMQIGGVRWIWSRYSFVLGFLLVFRNGQAYARFKMGTRELLEASVEWMDSASSLVAFCSQEDKFKEQARHFFQLLVRLMSMLHCAGLQAVSSMEDDSQEIIDPGGIDPAALDFLMNAENKVEVLVTWIKELCIAGARSGLIIVPPPVLGRVLMQLTNGQTALSGVKQIRNVSFPFPYAQILSGMMLIHWSVTPLFAALSVHSTLWCMITTFFVTACMWSLLYIAIELDQPFGDDFNDLPLRQVHREFNKGLLQLLQPDAFVAPSFEPPKGMAGLEVLPPLRASHEVFDTKLTRRKFSDPGNELDPEEVWEALKQPLVMPCCDDALKAPLP